MDSLRDSLNQYNSMNFKLRNSQQKVNLNFL